MSIPAGQIVAIVGLNGAGKSTLVKLLCRFYDPDEGSIELDGIDLRDLPIEELRQQMTVLFQEPVRFNTTVAESIALGDSAANAASRSLTFELLRELREPTRSFAGYLKGTTLRWENGLPTARN